MKPKLVKLKDEDWEKLEYIAERRNCDNLTDALRLCIRETFQGEKTYIMETAEQPEKFLPKRKKAR